MEHGMDHGIEEYLNFSGKDDIDKKLISYETFFNVLRNGKTFYDVSCNENVIKGSLYKFREYLQKYVKTNEKIPIEIDPEIFVYFKYIHDFFETHKNAVVFLA